jgi:hypothetical protein
MACVLELDASLRLTGAPRLALDQINEGPQGVSGTFGAPKGAAQTPGAHYAAMHLLIIEDDLDLGRALQQSLKAEQISSEWIRRSKGQPLSPTGIVLRPLPGDAFEVLGPLAEGGDVARRERGEPGGFSFSGYRFKRVAR